MSIIPALTAKKIIRALKRAGFIEDRQKGSHVILLHPITKARAVVPVHSGKTVKKEIIHDIIVVNAKMKIEDFLKLL